MGNIILYPRQTIMDLQASLDPQAPNKEESFQPLKGKLEPGDIIFSSKENIQYGVTSPLYYILLDSFKITVNNHCYFIHMPKDVIYEEMHEFPLETSKYSHFMNSVEKKFLPKFSYSLLNQFSQISSPTMDKMYVEMAIKNGLQELSIDSNQEYKGIAKKIQFLKEKLEDLEISLSAADALALKSANRRLKIIFGAFLTQVFLIQYGTYYAFSWDIMEPITCLLGIFDIILAYGFWLRNERPYSFEALWNTILTKRLNKYQRKLQVFTHQKEEILEEMERLTVEKDLRAEKLEGILSVLNRNESK